MSVNSLYDSLFTTLAVISPVLPQAVVEEAHGRIERLMQMSPSLGIHPFFAKKHQKEQTEGIKRGDEYAEQDGPVGKGRAGQIRGFNRHDDAVF